MLLLTLLGVVSSESYLDIDMRGQSRLTSLSCSNVFVCQVAQILAINIFLGMILVVMLWSLDKDSMDDILLLVCSYWA